MGGGGGGRWARAPKTALRKNQPVTDAAILRFFALSLASSQGLTLVPVSAQLEITLPLSAQLKHTLPPI